MSKRTVQSVVLVVTIGFALVFANGVVFAQDQQPEPQTTKSTTTKQKKSKRTSPVKKNTDVAPAAETTGDQVTTPRSEPPAVSATQSRATATTTLTDLSGSYVGTFKCDELGLTGDTTLTINGNQFSTADGKTGRIVASTTAGYTAVALQMGDASTSPPTVISLRGRKSGERLTLTSLAGSTNACSFMPASASARRRRSQEPTPSASGSQVASPAEVGPAPGEVSSPKTRRNTKRSRTSTPTPPAPSTSPMPTTPTETPVPTQTPSPVPSPSPSPSGSPAPSPSPEGSPNPSPSPSPSPSPRPTGT